MHQRPVRFRDPAGDSRDDIARAAAVDLSGNYVGVAWVPFTVTVVQTGTALQMIGHVVVNDTTAYPLAAAGTVDPATGAFSVAGEVTGLRADFAYSGTGDGEEIPGTFTPSRTCPSRLEWAR